MGSLDDYLDAVESRLITFAPEENSSHQTSVAFLMFISLWPKAAQFG